MRCLILISGLLVTNTGCKDGDRTRMERIGQLAHERLREKFPGIPVSFDGFREALRSDGPGSAIEVRVRSRMKSDNWLHEAKIGVRETVPGRVVLSGTLDGPDQKQRALDLARNAVGVEAVVDDLSVGE